MTTCTSGAVFLCLFICKIFIRLAVETRITGALFLFHVVASIASPAPPLTERFTQMVFFVHCIISTEQGESPGQRNAANGEKKKKTNKKKAVVVHQVP